MRDEWELYAEGVAAAEAILKATFGIEVRKALNPLNLHDFQTIVRTLAVALKGQVVPVEDAALKQALGKLDAKWTDLGPEARAKVINEAAHYLGPPVVAKVLPKLDQTLAFAQKDIVPATKKNAVLTYDLHISPDLNATDERIANYVRVSQGHFITNKYGDRQAQFANQARRIVASGLEKGWGSAAIAEELYGELSMHMGRGLPYWNTIAMVYANRARTMTQLASYHEAGIEAYVWESVLDEATCFAQGTRVRMADGAELAIECVRPGDRVLSLFGRSRTVLATRVMPARRWVRLRFGGEWLCVTPQHPFLTARGWLRADQLRAGSLLVQHEGSDLSSLWEDVPEDDVRDAEILLDRLSSTTPDVQPLRAAVSDASPLCGSRSGKVLFRRLSQGGIREGRVLGDASEDLRRVWRDFLCNSVRSDGRQEAHDLFQGVSKVVASNSTVCWVRHLFRDEGERESESVSSVLFPSLLSRARGFRWCNGTGDAGALRVGGSRFLVRERGQDRQDRQDRSGEVWPLVDGRFPDRQADRTRSRWGLLAREDTVSRCGAGPADGSNGIGGRARVGCRGETRSDERTSCPLGIWPRPDVGRIAARARFVKVELVEHEVTGREPAYDLEVEDDAGFVAGGVVVHNSTVCRFLHGQRFPVAHAMQRFQQVEDAESPEAIKTLQPFVSLGRDGERDALVFGKGEARQVVAHVEEDARGKKDEIGSFANAMDGSALRAAGITVPPIHGNCRSTVIPEY